MTSILWPRVRSSGSSQTVLLIFAIIILSALRRTYNMHRGTRFSMARTVLFLAVYVGIGLVFSGTSFYEGVPLVLAPVYALVLAGAAATSYMYSDRRVTFWRSSDGSIYFRGGVILYIIYLVGLVVRLTIDYVVIGPNVFSLTPVLTLNGTALYATIATDLLLMFGVGLLAGRNLRVLRRYQRIERGEDTIPDSPSPLGSEAGGSAPSKLSLARLFGISARSR
jgi:hypothetical protein